MPFAGIFPLEAADALITDRTHPSEALREIRNYRIFLPPGYGDSGKRYPVIYWFHGYSERHNKPITGQEHRNYDKGPFYGEDTLSGYVANHDVIVVKWDGYNPRTPDEKYPRPYNIGPVETDRQFPLYFPELVSYIDAGYRTIADRNHRATAGLSMGGFMSFWIAGKYPHLVSSASNFMGSTEFFVGPRGYDVEYRHEEMRGNYDGVRTRLVTGAKDFIRFYHRRMNAIWNFTRANHETEEFDFDHGTPGMSRTLDFHMRAFASPLTVPLSWNHIDVYPFFSVWDWNVASNRKRPGFTVLENVSKSGFRSSVREWVPDGAVLSQIKLSITTARLYPAGSPQTITTIRLKDGVTRRLNQKADAEGRLGFELDGEEYEVGISAAGMVALSDFRIENDSWATAGRPVRLLARFWNKGAAALLPQPVRWESLNPNVSIQTAIGKLPALTPGKSAEVGLAFTVLDQTREIVKFTAVAGGQRLPMEVPMFPPAAAASDFRIADGKSWPVFQHATETQDLALGSGNADGQANRGETVAILLPDGKAFRAAELFTNDRCVDNTTRVSDYWGAYDHVGASAKYSLPTIRRDCPAGHTIRFLARILMPNKPEHQLKYAAIDVPVR